VDDKLEIGARLKLDQSETLSENNDLQSNMQVMQTAFNGTPALNTLVEMIEELHGTRCAYLDFMHDVRKTRIQ
jgi:hypothetical protein